MNRNDYLKIVRTVFKNPSKYPHTLKAIKFKQEFLESVRADLESHDSLNTATNLQAKEEMIDAFLMDSFSKEHEVATKSQVKVTA